MQKNITVYSLESNILILEKNIPELIRTCKLHNHNSEKIQKALTIWTITNEYGWLAHQKNENIVSLSYRSDSWGLGPMSFISLIARFVEPGGYIKMADDNTKTYWAYIFNGKKVERRSVSIKHIDFKNKKDLENNLNEIIFSMFKIGFTKTNIHMMIQKIFVQEILSKEANVK